MHSVFPASVLCANAECLKEVLAGTNILSLFIIVRIAGFTEKPESSFEKTGIKT
jgi:hypothetical protein